jgi:hypothetical protein
MPTVTLSVKNTFCHKTIGYSFALQTVWLLWTWITYKSSILHQIQLPQSITQVLWFTSVISCINRTGRVSVVMSLEHAIFRMFRSPKITGCLELISSENGNELLHGFELVIRSYVHADHIIVINVINLTTAENLMFMVPCIVNIFL